MPAGVGAASDGVSVGGSGMAGWPPSGGRSSLELRLASGKPASGRGARLQAASHRPAAAEPRLAPSRRRNASSGDRAHAELLVDRRDRHAGRLAPGWPRAGAAHAPGSPPDGCPIALTACVERCQVRDGFHADSTWSLGADMQGVLGIAGQAAPAGTAAGSPIRLLSRVVTAMSGSAGPLRGGLELAKRRRAARETSGGSRRPLCLEEAASVRQHASQQGRASGRGLEERSPLPYS